MLLATIKAAKLIHTLARPPPNVNSNRIDPIKWALNVGALRARNPIRSAKAENGIAPRKAIPK